MRFWPAQRQLTTMASPAREPERIAALDGVRGVAILLVLVMHGLYIGPFVEHAFLLSGYARVACLGWCGVDVFFVLSGFLITGILVRSKGGPGYFRNFYARRTLRIFPLYYLVVALVLFVLPRPGLAPGADVLPTSGDVAHLLYYQNWWFALERADVAFPLKITWSLAIEEQFYLLWPALVALVSTRALRAVCVAVILAAIALRFWLLDQGFVNTHFLTPCRLDALALGALLAVTPSPRAWLGYAATAAGVVGLLTTAFVGGESIPESVVQQRWGLLAALSLGGGLLILARQPTALQPLFRFSPLRSLGKYSYCIYLTHMLVIEALVAPLRELGPQRLATLSQALSPLGVVIAFTLAAVCCSWLLAFVSYHAFERWFLGLKRHFPSVQ